jgi:nucleotide-binding universal stress UspA family protein
MSYRTGLYKLDKRYKRGIRQDHDLPATLPLPPKLSFDDISNIMAEGQSICFKDQEIKENKERILTLLKTKWNEYPTIAVALSINYDGENYDGGNYSEFNDAGALTIQKVPLNVIAPVDDKSESYWIHEVCRSKRVEDKIPEGSSPVKLVMERAIQYVRNLGGTKIYLLVDKDPDHGTSDFLLSYYNEKYGFDIIIGDEQYWYMAKNLTAGVKEIKEQEEINEKVKKAEKIENN